MVDPILIPNSGAPDVGPAGAQPAARAEEGGAAFRALLEQLAERARELEKTSAKAVDAAELAGAVEEAHESLQDALSLSAQLIEAWRADAQQRSAPPDRPGAGPTQPA